MSVWVGKCLYVSADMGETRGKMVFLGTCWGKAGGKSQAPFTNVNLAWALVDDAE
jgi:hypothetical protein